MIRTARFVGGAALIGALGLLAPGTAQAAAGTVTINNTPHVDPVGCLVAEDTFYTTMQITVGNGTDRPIKAYTSNDCTGQPIGELPPEKMGFVPKGGSILVD